MPHRLIWSGARDMQLHRLRAEGQSWDAIAAALAISRNAAIERGRRIGARLAPQQRRPSAPDPDRPPLPPGHPISWGLINQGTCLADAPYPIPPTCL